MKLILESEIFESRNSNVLHALANLALSGRHRIEIEDEQNIFFKEWHGELKLEDRDQWDKVIAEGYILEAREPARRAVRIANIKESNWKASPPRLPIAAAIDELVRPFRVLVENSRSDRAFLLCMADAVQREALLRLEKRKVLEFEHGSGVSYMPSIIENIANSDPRNVHPYLVVFDSDAQDPGIPSDQSEHLRKTCVKANFAFHQLKRRNIENYLTIDSLRGWAYSDRRKERRRIFDAFIKLNDDQRFHLKLKNGFSGQFSQSLYATVSVRDREALSHGFGPDITDIFTNGSLSEGHLRRDGAWAEMNPVIVSLLAFLR